MSDKKKILIVGRTFHPQKSPRSFRTTELAQELARQGHDVSVILPQNFQEQIDTEFLNLYNIRFIYYGPLKWTVLGKSKWLGDWPRKLGRLLFLLFEHPNIEIYFKLPKYLKSLKGFDLAISIAVPHENHWAFAKARSSKQPIAQTWIADCGDPFVGNVLETIRPPFYFRLLENSFLKKADFIAVPTAGSIKAYNSNYHHKFKVIPQGFSFEKVNLATHKPSYTEPNFAYAGGVTQTGVRSLHGLIRVLLEQEKSFKFHIYSTNAAQVLADLAKGHEDKIIFHKAIQRHELLYELSKMNFLVNLDNGTSLNTPSKLIDYALCKRPILNVNPLNPDRQLLMSFLEEDYSMQFLVSDISKYDIKNVACQFLNTMGS